MKKDARAKLEKIMNEYVYDIGRGKLEQIIIELLGGRKPTHTFKKIETLKEKLSLVEGITLSEAFDIVKSRPENGAFYTPKCLADLVGEIAFILNPFAKNVYDNSIGLGSLITDYAARNGLKVYGKELNYDNKRNVSEMLTELDIDNEVFHGNTLEMPSENVETDTGKYDISIINPPYGVKYDKEKLSEGRFKHLPKKSDSTLLFVQDALEYSDKVIAILSNGILFQKTAVEDFRKEIIKDNYLDAVIGLPSSMFENTSIPVTIMIFDKTRSKEKKVQFINAEKDFVNQGKRSVMTRKNIERLVDTYGSYKLCQWCEELKYIREGVKDSGLSDVGQHSMIQFDSAMGLQSFINMSSLDNYYSSLIMTVEEKLERNINLINDVA